jgi:hypothetical protein
MTTFGFGPEYVPTPEERRRWVSFFNTLMGGMGEGDFPEDRFPELRRRVKQQEIEDRIIKHYGGVPADMTPMSREELQAVVRKLGGPSSSARLLGFHSGGTVSAWLRGKWRVRPRVVAILRHLAALDGVHIARRGRPEAHHRLSRNDRRVIVVHEASEGSVLLRKYIVEHRLTLRQFAAMVGVTAGSVGHWVQAQNCPRPQWQRKLLEVAGIDPESWDNPALG